MRRRAAKLARRLNEAIFQSPSSSRHPYPREPIMNRRNLLRLSTIAVVGLCFEVAPPAGDAIGQQAAKIDKAKLIGGMVAQFGTWSFSEADKALTQHVEGALFPNGEGADARL